MAETHMANSRSPIRTLCRAALLSGLFACAVCAPAAAEDTVRGLIVDNGQTRFNGIAVEGKDPQVPLQNGGYPLHQRSSSATILRGPGAKRKVIQELSSEYDRPVVPVPRPAPVAVPPTEPDLPPR
jgi:hypothetical protein